MPVSVMFGYFSCNKMSALRTVCVFSLPVLTIVFIYLMYREQLTYMRLYTHFVPTRDKSAVIGITRRPTKSVQPTAPAPCATPPVPQKEYEFVIAHYKEQLDWLRPIANLCHVYDKGHDSGLKPTFSINRYEELPNVGKESHTYLYHIIKNYENLANITVFLQGDICNHAPKYCFPTPLEFLEKARKGLSCVTRGEYSNWGRIRHTRKWKNEYDHGLMRRANSTVGQFYRAVFGRAHPKSVDYCLAGCFSATRRCLQKHPKEFYQNMISFVDDHVNPEEGHYIERLWHTVVAC